MPVTSLRRASAGVAELPSSCQFAIEFFVLRDYPLGGETRHSYLAASPTQTLSLPIIADHSQRRLGHSIDVADLEQVSTAAVLNHFGYAADARRNDGHFAGHRLQRSQAERFRLAWE